MMLAFQSCDWLDVKSSTELDRDELFSSEQGYREAIVGVYSSLGGSSLYGTELSWGMLDVLGGRYIDLQGSYNKYSSSSYKHNTSDSDDNAIAAVDAIWGSMYEQIANLNSIINTIDDNQNVFTGNNYSILKGEAIGLRAFLHFELLRMYGPDYVTGKDTKAIPFVSELTTKVSTLLTVDQALTIIIDQLKQAIELMKEDPIVTGETPSKILASLPSGSYSSYGIESWHNRRFHFNYFAAKAALARAYLWKGDKEDAKKEALDVIAYQESRFPWVNTSNLTTIGSTTAENQDRTFATEHIFALNIADFETLLSGLLMADTGSSSSLLNSDKSIFEGLTADIRYQYLYTTSGKKSLLSKYIQPTIVASFFKSRLPIIRISEMYYIAAECESDPNTAARYLDIVRSHRGLSNEKLQNMGLSLEEVKDEIKKEYQKEFCGEGQMWYYYKRNRITAIPNMKDYGNLSMFVFDRPEDETLYGDNSK